MMDRRETELKTKRKEIQGDNFDFDDGNVDGDLSHPNNGANHNENKEAKHHHKVLRKAKLEHQDQDQDQDQYQDDHLPQ